MTGADQVPQVSVVTIDLSTIYGVLQEVRDQGISTGGKVDALSTKVDSLVKNHEDHEARIRELEKRETPDGHEERIRAVENRKTVAPWQLWTAFAGGVGVFGGLIAIFNQLGGVG